MPKSHFFQKWAQPIFVPASVLIAVVAILALVARQYEGLQDSVRHATDVKGRLTLVYSLVQEAEAGVRGFILTTDAFYLVALNEAGARLTPELDALTDLVADNAHHTQALVGVRKNVLSRIGELKQLVNAAQAGDAARVIEDMRARVGFNLLQAIRSSVDAMIAEEDRLLIERRQRATATASVLQFLAYGTLFLVMTVAVLSLAAVVRRREYLEGVEADLRAANDRLSAEMLRRERAEDQLRQAQKMEAIGQLTGGIAHDFNNMLAVIMGALNIMQRRLDRGDFDVQPLMQAAIEGAQRGGALTQRLLAFARKQVLEPRPLDANKLVSGMSDLLRRTLGETIQTEIVLSGALWLAYTDAHQLETAILNLVVNARDAMPEGGRLTIETSNATLDENNAASLGDVSCGDYVVLSITDTGMGMPTDVISRAFDPFFTTKGPGKGTGLGLSQVYGFVKQSGGHINVHSELGHGTTFNIYLPRFHGESEGESMEKAEPPLSQGRAGETILVVEDDDAVRRLAVEGLGELGYRVLQAQSAQDALNLLDEHPAIALLFTDVVMPQANGRELAEEAWRRQPDLKVLFTTGYTHSGSAQEEPLLPGVRMIGKPYTLQELSRTVRDILDF